MTLQNPGPLSGTPVVASPLPSFGQPQPVAASDGLSRHVAYGYGVIAIMFLGIFGWAATTNINGAVVGGGRVIVKSIEKMVQHPTGGVVGKISVAEGSRVREGDLLIRLDDTIVKANLDIIQSALSGLKARLARLQAERDRLATVTYPASMTAKPTPEDMDSMRSETQFFVSRRNALENHKAQLRSKIAQLQEQIKGTEVSIDSRKRQWDLIEEELASARGMLGKKLTTKANVTGLAETAARLEGEYGALVSDKASLNGQVAETHIQIAGLDEQDMSEVMRDLRETESRIAEQEARRLAAQDQLARIEMRAPASGTVHEMTVHTIGGVINPGEAIMKIVPDDAALEFEVRISPTDIDQVHLGQEANLRFPAFSRNRTPDLKGVVTLIGADASLDKQTGRSFYELKISPDQDMQAKLDAKGVTLVPGMPVEVYMETTQRTALSYFLKPLTDQIEHAFREE